jgi:hypothetical protein
MRSQHPVVLVKLQTAIYVVQHVMVLWFLVLRLHVHFAWYQYMVCMGVFGHRPKSSCNCMGTPNWVCRSRHGSLIAFPFNFEMS